MMEEIIRVRLMKIILYLNDKKIDFLLPQQIFGSFGFDENSQEESKLIHIEAKDGNWILCSTSDVQIIDHNQYVKEIKLEPNQFYVLRRDEKNYLIYVQEITFPGFQLYTYQKDLQITIGNQQNCSIQYLIPYMQGVFAKIYYRENRLMIERVGKGNIYINRIALKENAYYIKNGDFIDIYGLQMIFLDGTLFIRRLEQKILVNLELSKLTAYQFPKEEEPENVEIKNLELYSKNSYFSKPPRLRRMIETKVIKLSAPPRDESKEEMPIALVVGPMLTMGIMSGTMLLNTLMRISAKEATWASSWPQLVTSGAMLISMIVWPMVTQVYNRKMKKRKRIETVEKYTKYLNEKKEELLQEAKLQTDILYENLLTVEQCLNIIKHQGINFWDKRIDQSDFLVTRLGIGKEHLDVKIEYPDEGFTVDEDELRKQADQLVEEFQYISNVPIGYSFYQNKTTAIMGTSYKVMHLMHNILLQLMTFYSYEDVKIVLFTNQERKEQWNYLRYLKHCFNNEESIRFFADDLESAKNVADYLQLEIHNRMQQKENHSSVTLKPYYFIVIDDYDQVRYHELIKLITETDENLGFSLVILENRLSKLPSKCNNFISVGENSSGILKNSYENQEQVTFTDEIKYDINMMDVVKQLSNIPIEFEDGVSSIPDSISFLEMEKVGKVEQLNILNRWNTNDSTTSLKAEIGVDSQENLMYLDLHEKAHGPHGLIAGMTGSGKSEFIITYILSMAINYSPDDVAFILIDYKGGGLAFAFENKAANVILPHLAGTITNLDKAELNRTLVSIDSEIKRRQEIFNQAREQLGESTIDIYKYQRFYKEGKLQEPVPHLFIICDEFAELKVQQPEFMDNLISVARIGRSLGIHLILATQKPSGVVNDQIWSNTKFRVCLKVQDESDSKEVLKVPDAAYLRQTGRFYLEVGYNEYFALGQSAWCGDKYYPSERIIKHIDRSVSFIDDSGNDIKNTQISSGNKITAMGDQLSAIMNMIIMVANQVEKHTRKLWLENVPDFILETDLQSKYQMTFDKKPAAIIGEYDAPEKQEQGIVSYHYLDDGNTIVYGTDGAERELFLNTLLYSTIKNYSSSQIQFYIIDYGSESLRSYLSCPHVGGMVFASEDEKYHNLLKMIREELQNRKRILRDYGGEYSNYLESGKDNLPVQVIIMNNFDSIYENNPDIYELLPELVRDSERYGIIFIFTVNAFNSLPSKISQNCSNIYAFHVKDNDEYTSIFNQRVKVMPRDIVGRGLLLNDGIHEFQVAHIFNEDENASQRMLEFVEEEKNKNQVSAKRIPTLPDVITLSDIQEYISNIHRVPIGIVKSDLQVCYVDYLNSLGNIVTSTKLENTTNFICSLSLVLEQMKSVHTMLWDASSNLEKYQTCFHQYYNQRFHEILDDLILSLEKYSSMSQKPKLVVFIYDFDKWISKLKDTNRLQIFVQKIKEYENLSLVIADSSLKIKKYVFEPWFASIFSVNQGVWIGRGISDQSLLHLSNVTRDMTKNYKNDMGYFVDDGLATLCKWIDFFVTEDVGDDHEE